MKFTAGVFAVLVAIQFIPYGREHTNPPVVAEPAWDSPTTRTLTERACFDCHSNRTVWPGYAHVAPVSWLLQYDVEKGRAALNFSEWQRPQEHADDVGEEIAERHMPPLIYRVMHSGARLDGAEREELARSLERTIAAMPPPAR
jgi:hypothetical protein